MLTDQTSESQVVIACNPNAIPADRRARWEETGKQVYAAVQEAEELPNGYRFRLPTDSAMLLRVADYISNERLCCAFLHFTLEVEPLGGPIWLGLSGREGVKEYLRSVFRESKLLPEAV